MKILYLGVLRNGAGDGTGKALELAHAAELSGYNYFTRGPAEQFLQFFAAETAIRTPPNRRQRVEHHEQEKFIHLYGHKAGICGALVSDKDYDKDAAQRVLTKICEEFLVKYRSDVIAKATVKEEGSKRVDPLPFPELKEYLAKYQDPTEADPLIKIQKELDETVIQTHKSIEALLERGEKIDSLVAKSDNLSAQSKMFYTQAKKQNSCCVVM